MKMHKLVKPIILSCTLAANVASAEFMQSDVMDYNFVTVKGGIVSPASAPEGNSGLNTGNSTWTAGALVGRKFQDRFSVDVEYMYRAKNTMKNANSSAESTSNTNTANDSWSATTQTVMLNFSVDLLTDNKIRPYLRAGAGMSRNIAKNYIFTAYDAPNTSASYLGKTTNKFAYQVGAGLDIATSPKFNTQIEYMYVNHGKIETNQGTGPSNNGSVEQPLAPALYGSLKDHVITIGVKYKF